MIQFCKFNRSDTEFFSSLPQSARSYALPFEYTEMGLIKYGRNSLVHEWAVKKLRAVNGSRTEKLITICLNNSTDVVAHKDGRPLLSSHGF